MFQRNESDLGHTLFLLPYLFSINNSETVEAVNLYIWYFVALGNFLSETLMPNWVSLTLPILQILDESETLINKHVVTSEPVMIWT